MKTMISMALVGFAALTVNAAGVDIRAEHIGKVITSDGSIYANRR